MSLSSAKLKVSIVALYSALALALAEVHLSFTKGYDIKNC